MDRDGPETNKLVSDIADISIKESSSNGSSSSSSSHSSGLLWKGGLQPNDSNSKKEEGTVGSLSFSVISTASNQGSELAAKSIPVNAKNSPQKSLELRNSVRKPTARAKVPFEKGYSQMDWLKLTRSHPDLAGFHAEILPCSHSLGPFILKNFF